MKLSLSKALKLRIQEDGHVYGLLSHSDGEFYIAPEVLAILSYFASPKSSENILELEAHLKSYFKQTLHRLPTQKECVGIIEDLKSSGFLIESSKSSSFKKDDAGFADAWIQWAMLADSVRSQSYEKAISKTINKKSVVLDVGAGTGFLSACALFHGAQKVYAIEETQISKSILPLLKKLNVVQNKSQFKLYENNSFDVSVPHDVNLVVSELFGNDPFQEGLFSTLKDITEKLDGQNVQFIPNKLEVYAEVIDLKEHPIQQRIALYQKTKAKIDENENEKGKKSTEFYYGFLKTVTESLSFDSISFPIALLENQFERISEPVKLGECSLNPMICDEKKFEKQFKGHKKISCQVKKCNTPIVLLWFRAYLSKDISLSSHPQEKDFAHHWSPIAIVLETSDIAKSTLTLKYGLSESLNTLKCDVFCHEGQIGAR